MSRTDADTKKTAGTLENVARPDNLHWDEDDAPITLERLGTGVILTYRLSIIGDEEGEECGFRVQGTVRLDTRTNTLTGNIRLKELGCENGRQGLVVIGRMLN